MSKQTVKYVTTTGIDFEQFKPPIRVEAGEPIPARVDQAEIADLLDSKLIRAVDESEAEK